MNVISQPKIALVNEHNLYRSTLADSICNMGYAVTIQCKNGKELIQQLGSNEKLNLIILDFSLTASDCYDTASWLYENYPLIPVMVITSHESDFILFQLLKAGISCLLNKNVDLKILKEALESVLKNGVYYTSATTRKLAQVICTGVKNDSLIKLSFSETEVKFLKLVSSELTYKQIASQLSTSPRTIDKIRDELFIKHDLKCRVGLVTLAINAGFYNNLNF